MHYFTVLSQMVVLVFAAFQLHTDPVAYFSVINACANFCPGCYSTLQVTPYIFLLLLYSMEFCYEHVAKMQDL